MANEEIDIFYRDRNAASIIRACLQDRPEKRPTAIELKREFEIMCKKNPNKYVDKIQMLHVITRLVSLLVRNVSYNLYKRLFSSVKTKTSKPGIGTIPQQVGVALVPWQPPRKTGSGTMTWRYLWRNCRLRMR